MIQSYIYLNNDKMENKNNNSKNIILIILALIVVWLLARYVFFGKQIDELWEGLQRIQVWKDDYKAQHPDATEQEVNQAWENSMKWLVERQENYKKEHPNATQAEMDKAWSDARSGSTK